jgi:formate dehydrogenase major subunit
MQIDALRLCDAGTSILQLMREGASLAVILNSKPQEIKPGERLIDIINRSGVSIPQVCHHPQLGPIQTCDTCMVEMEGKLVRACATFAADGAQIETRSPRAQAAQRESCADHQRPRPPLATRLVA